MSDRVDLNVKKPVTSTETTTSTTNTNRKTIGNVFLEGAQAVAKLAGVGGAGDMARAEYNGMGCGVYGYGGAIFPVPGKDATDSLVWNLCFNSLPQLANISGSGVPGSMSSLPNFGWNNNTAATNATSEVDKIKNPADAFKEDNADKLKVLADKEDKLQKLMTKKKELEASGDKDALKALYPEIKALQDEYIKLDKELGGGSSLCKAFKGKQYNFYQNIDDKELKQIRDYNDKINSLKDCDYEDDSEGKSGLGLKQLLEKQNELQKERMAKASELQRSKGMWGIPVTQEEIDAALSEETRDGLKEVEQKIKDKNEAIEKAKKEMIKCVQKAAQDGSSVDFNKVCVDESEKASEKSSSTSSGTTGAKKVESAMVQADGNVKNKEEAIKAMKEIFAAEIKKGHMDDSDIKEVAELMYKDGEKDMSKDAYQKLLADKDFLENAMNKINTISETDDVQGKRMAHMFITMYEGICGTGSFEEKGKDAGIDSKKLNQLKRKASDWSAVENKKKTGAGNATKPEGESKNNVNEESAEEIQRRIDKRKAQNASESSSIKPDKKTKDDGSKGKKQAIEVDA